MKRTYKNMALLVATSLLLTGCNTNRKDIERDEAKDKVLSAYTSIASTDDLPNEYSLQSVYENKEGENEVVGLSINLEECTLYYAMGDEVAIGYDATEEDEEEFSAYTFDYSTDGGETFLEEPLEGEEALAKFEEYKLKAVALTLEKLLEEKTIFTASVTKLEALEATINEKEEEEEGDLRLDISELYYESDDELHFGFTYQYGPVVAELDEEGEQAVDEDDNPIFNIDDESELYQADFLAVHLDQEEDVYYPSLFISQEVITYLTVGSLVYAGEIFPEE